MKGLFKIINNELLGNTALVSTMGYSLTNKNIRRGYGNGGTWERLLVFYTQPESVLTDYTPDIRRCRLLVTIYDRKNDLLVDDIGEQVISILNGINKKIEGEIYIHGIFYAAELIPLVWNEEINAWNKCLVFNCTYRHAN